MVRVLRVTLVLAACTALLGAAPGGSPSPAKRALAMPERPEGAPAIDWEQVRRNTREYEGALARHRAAVEPAPSSKWPGKLLDSTQRCLPPLEPWQRAFLPPAPSEEERKDLDLSTRAVTLAEQFIESDARKARAHLDEQEKRLQGAKNKDTLLVRLEEQRGLLEQRVAQAKQLAEKVRFRIAERDGTFGGRVKEYVHNATYSDAASELQKLRGLMDQWQATRKPRVLSTDLSYVAGSLSSVAPVQGHVVPAYASASSAEGLEDTTAGREVELSPEVVAKAQELATPAKAYDFVKNELRLDWYYGSLKGSTETLREKRGNDADLAALLIALLRAQGHPARYVRGAIELPIAKVADLMGLLTEQELQQAYAPGTAYVLLPATRDIVLKGLSAAGIPYEPLQSGGQIAGVRLTHVWVEAFIGYADYRGAGDGREGKQWVAIDPAIPGAGKYAATAPALDALTSMGMTAEALTASYLAQASQKTALEFFRGEVQTWVSQNHSELTYGQLLRTVRQVPEHLSFIPGSLPYKVASVQDELPFLPDDFKQRAHIVVSDATGALLETTLPLHQLIGHRTTLTFEPATEADREAIALAGGLYATPASLVQLLPTVRVDGLDKAVGTRSAGLGEEQTWAVELLLPNGSKRRIANEVIAGNVVALGFGGPLNKHAESGQFVTGDQDGDGPKFVYGRAAAYANAWTASEEELAQLLGVVPIHPTGSVVFVENQLEVRQALGVRLQVLWKGLQVDADLRTMTPLELQAGRGKDLLRLSGYEGSSQEAKVLTEGTGVAAVSAVTVVQAAKAQAIPVLNITPANASTELPKLVADAEVLAEVSDQIGRGREIVAPARALTIEDWTGTGFIARDPKTEEGGYYLSGVVSGGMTVLSPERWADENLVSTLDSNPPPFTEDASLAKLILKVKSNDMQTAVAGAEVKQVRVLVLTEDLRPVKGASVTFSRVPGPNEALPAFGRTNDAVAATLYGTVEEVVTKVRSTPAIGETITVQTDQTGFARIWVTPDPKFDRSAVILKLQQTDPNAQILGYNKLTASVAAGPMNIRLAEPIYLLGLPTPAAQMKKWPDTWARREAGIEFEVAVWVYDRFSNVLANQNVLWTSAPLGGKFVDPALVPGAGDPATRPDLAVKVLNSLDPSQVNFVTLVTEREGYVKAHFIGSNDPGDVTVVASTGTPRVEADFPFSLFVPGEYTLQVITRQDEFYDGIKGTSFQQPIVAEILRNTGSGWRPIDTNDNDIETASVTMVVRNAADGTTLATKTLDAAKASDTPGRMFFWPRYDLEDGWEYLKWTASVKKVGEGTANDCQQIWTLLAESTRPTISFKRVLPDGSEVPASACGFASVGDQAIKLSIHNSADYGIYASVREKPQISGQQLVLPLRPEDLVANPTGVGERLIPIPAEAIQPLWMPIIPGTAGGTIEVDVYAANPAENPSDPPLVKVASSVIQLRPSMVAFAKSAGEAKYVFPVRNAESTKTPDSPTAPPGSEGIRPFAYPAACEFCVAKSGELTLSLDGHEIGKATVTVAEDGKTTLAPISGTVPEVTGQGLLRVFVGPGTPGIVQKLQTQLTQADNTVTAGELDVATVGEDSAAMPIGHTFVKDVSVVDGHLTKQFEDLRLTGRGAGLAFVRSYTSGGMGDGPLGDGWTHNYRSFVIVDGLRYMVVGGEGTGQVFTCTSSDVCTPQRGYHGTLSLERSASKGILKATFRSKGGVAYEYKPYPSLENPPRWRLGKITDPVGNVTVLTYSETSNPSEVARVYEPQQESGAGPGGRFMEFEYESQPVTDPAEYRQVQEHIRLTRVTLREVDAADPTGEKFKDIAQPVVFTYDPWGNLGTATRAGRVDQFQYVPWTSFDKRGIRNNLKKYTDPNGNETTYTYFAKADVLPGESGYLYFGDKEERVKTVTDADGATNFTYNLEPAKRQYQAGVGHLAGLVVTVSQTTEVRSPRTDVTKPTTYRVDAYGGASSVSRPISETLSAESFTQWDRVHQTKVWEVDARGRKTEFTYDALGNMNSRTTLTSRLAASGDVPQTEDLVDGDGRIVSSVREVWAYDQNFSALICHADPLGRVTTNTLDSATGVRLATTRHANLSSVVGASCPTPSASPRDEVWRYHYQGIDGCSGNPANAKKGDLCQTVDPNGIATSVTSFDDLGNATASSRPTTGGKSLTTSSIFDRRSRLLLDQDSLGHSTEHTWDELDRPLITTRKNTKGGSPDVVEVVDDYYPAGQLMKWHNGLGLQRETTLDRMNRPHVVTESGGGLAFANVTTLDYDSAGNKVAVTDGRGVKKTTVYDWADRPVATKVCVADKVKFGEQGGEESALTSNSDCTSPATIATAGYDAAGNKVFETDLHGHQTDYKLDPLYRVAGAVAPAVPGMELAEGISASIRYETKRRFDLTGNKVYEEDGNGHATTWKYDFAGRVSETVDAEGRYETRGYDPKGNLVSQESGHANGAARTWQLKRTISLKGEGDLQSDGLDRPRLITEEVKAIDGLVTYPQKFAYDDTKHESYSRDRRGALLVRKLDDLDRVFAETIDASSAGALARESSLGAPVAATTTFVFDANGNRKLTTDARRRVTTDTYDGLNRLKARSLPMGVAESTTYDTAGQAMRRTDRRGIQHETTYDAIGRPISERLLETISNSSQPLTVLARSYVDAADGAGVVKVIETDANGHSTTHSQDALHREITVEDARGKKVQSRWDAVQKRAVRDRLGFVTKWEYDAVGRVTGQRDYEVGEATEKFSQTTGFDDDDRTQAASDRRGITTTSYLDGLGRVEKVIRAHGALSRTDATFYDENGNVIKTVDANNHVATAQFDGANRRVAETRGYGSSIAATTTHTFDRVGNELESKSARVTGFSYDVRSTYDDLNRPVRSENALGQVTTRAFDAVGNKVCEVQPLGGFRFDHGDAGGRSVASLISSVCGGSYTMHWTWDEASKLLSTIDAQGEATSFVWDKARNLVAKQDANGHLTTYEYDALNRRTAEHQHLDAHTPLATRDRGSVPAQESPVNPLSGTGTLTWTSAYDDNGNVLTVTDPKNQVVTNTWGILGRVEHQNWSNHATPREWPSIDGIDNEFDPNGNLKKVTERKATATGVVSETTDRIFDELDRLSSETRLGRAVGYKYDAKGNRTKVTDADGVASDYTFDALDRLETVTAGGEVTTYSYWPDSLQKGIEYPKRPNQAWLKEMRCYDAASRLTTLVASENGIGNGCEPEPLKPYKTRFGYSYDDNGNRLTQAEERTDPVTQALNSLEETGYRYDSLDRLAAVRYPDGHVAAYNLDAVGNRLGERETAAGGVQASGPIPDYDGVAFSTLTKNAIAMFNRADWLMSQSDAVDPAKSVSFAYDLNGNQTGRGTATSTRQMKWDARNTLTAVYENGTEVGRYDYDRNLIRVRRTTQTENVEYVLDDKHVLNELDGSQAGKPSIRRYHYGTKVLAVTESAGTSYVLNDGIGSATDFWSASGTLAKSRQYDAWGNFRNGTAPAAGEAKVAYTGHQYDPETGWVYAKARYYDSGLGVFLSRDSYPFGPTDAPNLYLYARGNPLRYWDPDGYFFKEMVEGMENLPGAAWNLAKEFGGYVKGNVQEIGEDLGLAQPESREATPLKVPEAARREIPQYVAPTEEQVADRIEKASFEAPRANVPQQGGGRKEMTVFEGKQDRLVRQQRVDRAQAKEIAKAVAQEVASAAIVAGTVIATDMVAEYAAPLVRGSDVAEVGARGFSAEGRMARAGKRPVLNQGNAPICGKTSADMVLDDLVPGVPRNVQGMPTPTKTGVGIDKVANYLERNNVNARFQPWTTVDELAEATAKGDPAIAAVRQKAWDPEVGKMVEGGHAVVVDGVTTRQGVRVVAVRDPWGTQYFETVESFSDRWIKGQTVVTNGVKPSP